MKNDWLFKNPETKEDFIDCCCARIMGAFEWKPISTDCVIKDTAIFNAIKENIKIMLKQIKGLNKNL